MTEPRDSGASPQGPTTEAVVDLAAIAHNTELLAGRARGALMAVVKADGFGHGMVQVARTALAHGASALGVTSCAEALELRAAGITAPVLSWLHAAHEDFGPALRAGIELSASSSEHLAGIAASAERTGAVASVHLKADTGLSRNGAAMHDWPELVAGARGFEERGLLSVTGLWSHLTHADQPRHPGTAVQMRVFDQAVAHAREAGLRPMLCHLANSAATLALPGSHYDLVRVGIGLYGVEPVRGETFGLSPAMSLRSHVINVKRVPGGTGVSYGHDYTTGRDCTLALVPLGYADGVPRSAAGRAQVWIGGVRRPIAGRVAMDQFVVDVGEGEVGLGDEVVVLGNGARGEPTVAEWAGWAGTNPHEILTGIGGRVPRRHVRESPVRARGRELFCA